MGKRYFPRHTVELGEHPVSAEHLSRLSHRDEDERWGWSSRGAESRIWDSRERLEQRRHQGMQGSRGGTRMVRSNLEGDTASKVARSPEEALLDGFSPGPKGCISAWIVEAERAALLPYARDLWLAGKCHIPDEHRRADGREQGIKTHLPMAARSPWPARSRCPSQHRVCWRTVPLGSRAVRAV